MKDVAILTFRSLFALSLTTIADYQCLHYFAALLMAISLLDQSDRILSTDRYHLTPLVMSM